MKIKSIFPLLICAVFVMASCDPAISSSGSLDSSSSSSSQDSSSSSSSSSTNIKQTIASFSSPDSIVKYKATLATREDAADISDPTKTLSEDKFFITDNSTYKVGDDNPFKFLPEIDVYDANFDLIPLTSYHSISHVEILESGVFRELNATEMNTYVIVDNVNSTFDFTETAIGHKFKLRVLPNSEYYILKTGIVELSFEIEVVEGYNVHTIAELSMLDNHNAIWAEYKAAHGLSMDVKPKGIILHDDMKVTVNDLPAGFFYTANDITEERMPGINAYTGPDGLGKEAVVGSLKDWVTLYTHDTPVGETFIFDGNFFTVDGQDIPVIRKAAGDTIDNWQKTQGSHAQLFGFPGDGSGELTNSGDGAQPYEVPIPAGVETEQGEVSMRNMNAIGNGGRENTGLSNGGFIFTKSAATKMTWENVLSRNMFISYFSRKSIPNDTKVKSYINYCKSYDSYSTMAYYWGSDDNFINNSILKRSGGSLIISDELWFSGDSAGDYPNRHLSNLTTDNCQLESKVTGTEPWFVNHNAGSALDQLKALGALFEGYAAVPGVNPDHHNIVIEQTYMNVIALLIRGDNVFDNTYTELKSVVKINNASQSLDPFGLSQTAYAAHAAAGGGQFLTFESANGGRGYFNGTDSFVIADGYTPVRFDEALGSGNPIYMQNVSNFFSGEMMNLYLKFSGTSKNIGIVFGY